MAITQWGNTSWEDNGNGTETRTSNPNSEGKYETLTQPNVGDGRNDHLHGYHNSDSSLNDYSSKDSTGQHFGHNENMLTAANIAANTNFDD